MGQAAWVYISSKNPEYGREKRAERSLEDNYKIREI